MSLRSTTQSICRTAVDIADSVKHHLHCTVCGTHFRFHDCVHWDEDPENRCRPCSEDRHCCPNCLEEASQPSSKEAMILERDDRRKKMRDIPSRQCTDCGLRFSLNESTNADSCPTCLTPTAVHVSEGKLFDGETAHDYIRNYFQLLADKRLLRVIRVSEDELAFHLLSIPLHDGTTFMLGTHLHKHEIDDNQIMLRLFTRSHRPKFPTSPLVRICTLVSTTVTSHVDVFKGLTLTEENDDNQFQLIIDEKDLVDCY